LLPWLMCKNTEHLNQDYAQQERTETGNRNSELAAMIESRPKTELESER
jgi:hypothetical protein